DNARHHRLYTGNGSWIAVQALPQIHVTAVAKVRDRLSGYGVDGLQGVVQGEQQTLIFFVLTFPVVQAPSRYPSQFGMNPYLLAGDHIQSNQGRVLSHHVHYRVDDNGIKEIETIVARWIHPGDF